MERDVGTGAQWPRTTASPAFVSVSRAGGKSVCSPSDSFEHAHADPVARDSETDVELVQHLNNPLTVAAGIVLDVAFLVFLT